MEVHNSLSSLMDDYIWRLSETRKSDAATGGEDEVKTPGVERQGSDSLGSMNIITTFSPLSAISHSALVEGIYPFISRFFLFMNNVYCLFRFHEGQAACKGHAADKYFKVILSLSTYLLFMI